MSKPEYVVLHVVENEEGVMASYAPQVAMAHQYDSPQAAAIFNVGNHPDAEKRGKPYRVITIPWEHWKEWEVYSESKKGQHEFRAYPSEHPTMRARSEARDMD